MNQENQIHILAFWQSNKQKFTLNYPQIFFISSPSLVIMSIFGTSWLLKLHYDLYCSYLYKILVKLKIKKYLNPMDIFFTLSNSSKACLNSANSKSDNSWIFVLDWVCGIFGGDIFWAECFFVKSIRSNIRKHLIF